MEVEAWGSVDWIVWIGWFRTEQRDRDVGEVCVDGIAVGQRDQMPTSGLEIGGGYLRFGIGGGDWQMFMDLGIQLRRAQEESLQIRMERTSKEVRRLEVYVMWEFSVALYMINIWPDSLLFTAIYGVVEAASTTLFGPVLRMWLFIRSLSFLAAGGAVAALLVYFGPASHKSVPFVALLVITNISGAICVLSTLAVVISNGQPPEVLVRMNSIIRRIDLICKLFAPVLTGFIISFVSLVASAVILALWNVLSVWLEYWLWITVYNGFPALSENKQSRKIEVFSNDSLGARIVELSNISREGTLEQERTNWKRKITERLSKLLSFDAWIVYFNQDVVLPGVALALLYFSVLRLVSSIFLGFTNLSISITILVPFGTLMTATLEWKGIPAYVIGIARGISAIIGIMATVVYPIVHSRISTLRTGLWSIWTQKKTVVIDAFASVGFPFSMFGVHLDKQQHYFSMDADGWSCCITAWIVDDQVSEADRCIVGGVQSSLQSMLDLLTCIMGMVVSDPRDFGQLVILSFIIVSSAAILYTFHCYRVRKHLLHLDKILAKIN
ncbi:hypothetical protein IEQ34_016608 [Dendrobium chrysotoxum]|uniref:Solute carrier family 40 member n=1 Tax=Dendrobium chrysotoxum TaxID=161865 RepID=A0AAV7GG78_DENCH|nr:hypothetical protein IEQ34_016608 [Dendrobium chrysotoxum]